MSKQIKSLYKLVILALFISVTVFSITKNAYATAIASVTYVEIWDSANFEWDYTYKVANQSDANEVLKRFYLESGLADVILTNISDLGDWKYTTDNTSYIQWEDSQANWPDAAIYPGNTLSFDFSSDKQLGDLYYELSARASLPVTTTLKGTSTSVLIPEATTISLLGLGLFFVSFCSLYLKEERANLMVPQGS